MLGRIAWCLNLCAYEPACQRNSAAVIIAHNHPSGASEPSHADELITQRVKEALALVDIRLLDHIIAGDAQCVSLATYVMSKALYAGIGQRRLEI